MGNPGVKEVVLRGGSRYGIGFEARQGISDPMRKGIAVDVMNAPNVVVIYGKSSTRLK